MLRLYRPAGDDTEFVVHPSYYPPFADRIDFGWRPQGQPHRTHRTRCAFDSFPSPAAKNPSVRRGPRIRAPDSSGTIEAFGTLENPGAQFGEFELELELTDAAGNVIANQSTPVLIAGSSAWIATNWEEALKLIRWEATDDELDILEGIEDSDKRLEAWNCFWRIRDPVPATATNEALVSYFQRVETANKTWHSALRPGYQSDRGRVFITLGPPDEIIERPMPAGPVPFEIWLYHDYNVEIRFVDRIGFNNYELDNIGEYQSEVGRLEQRKGGFLQDRADECPLLAPAFE